MLYSMAMAYGQRFRIVNIVHRNLHMVNGIWYMVHTYIVTFNMTTSRIILFSFFSAKIKIVQKRLLNVCRHQCMSAL